MASYSLYGIIVSSEDDLCHFGIKGQKWGIRRFQNEDGTLTKEGKQRYRVNSVGEYRKKQLEGGKSIADSASNITGKTADIIRRKRNKEAYNVSDKIHKMSDDELRRRINRIQMERQYANLTSSDRNSGRERAIEILETTGSIIGIVGGTLGIAATIKSLMGSK